MTQQEILKAAVEAMEDLYGLKQGNAVIAPASLGLPDTMHFHFTTPDGRRIHVHRQFNAGMIPDHPGVWDELVNAVSYEILRQLQP